MKMLSALYIYYLYTHVLRSYQRECWVWSGSQLPDQLKLFLKEYFERRNFEKYLQMKKSHEKITQHAKILPDDQNNLFHRFKKINLYLLGYYAWFFFVVWNQLFKKTLSGIQSECQTVWIHIRMALPTVKKNETILNVVVFAEKKQWIVTFYSMI